MIHIIGESNYEGFDISVVVEGPDEVNVDALFKEWPDRQEALIGNRRACCYSRLGQEAMAQAGYPGRNGIAQFVSMLKKDHGFKEVQYNLVCL